MDKQRLGTFMLGGLAGALAGILLAPRSGRELRGSITSRAGEARERGRETYFDAQERMQERRAGSREGPVREDAAAPLPRLGFDTPEPVPGEPGYGFEAEPLVEPPPLRDVSRDAPRSDADTEELRRRIQETRSRLRSRLEEPGDG